MNGKGVKEVLGLVLAVGNYMNGGKSNDQQYLIVLLWMWVSQMINNMCLYYYHGICFKTRDRVNYCNVIQFRWSPVFNSFFLQIMHYFYKVHRSEVMHDC